jgi:hypothetical protein
MLRLFYVILRLLYVRQVIKRVLHHNSKLIYRTEKFIHVRAVMTQRGGRGVAPLILNFGNRWWSVVNVMLRPHYLQEKKLIYFERDVGWATPAPDMSEDGDICSPTRDSISRPTRT